MNLSMPSMPAAMPGMPDASEVVNQVAQELKDQVTESGMDACETFVDKLESLKDSANSGAGDLLEKAKQTMSELKQTFEDALSNPASLVPPGPFAAAAAWIGGEIAKKLKAVLETIKNILESLVDAAKDIPNMIKKFGETMKNAMASITKVVKDLMSLPAEVSKLADTVSGPGDLKDVDSASMKSKLSGNNLDSPLNDLDGLKGTTLKMSDTLKGMLEKLNEFIEGAPDMIKDAFTLPPPITCMTGCAMQQAPAPMTMMLEKVDMLKSFDLSKVLEMSESMSDNISGLDVSKVKDPVAKFSSGAKGPIDKLDSAVSMAKKMP